MKLRLIENERRMLSPSEAQAARGKRDRRRVEVLKKAAAAGDAEAITYLKNRESSIKSRKGKQT